MIGWSKYKVGMPRAPLYVTGGNSRHYSESTDSPFAQP